jgi:hypothetical protein
VSPLAIAFNRVAQEVRDRETATVEAIEHPFGEVPMDTSPRHR